MNYILYHIPEAPIGSRFVVEECGESADLLPGGHPLRAFFSRQRAEKRAMQGNCIEKIILDRYNQIPNYEQES